MTGTLFKPAKEQFLAGDDEYHAEMLQACGEDIPTPHLRGALHWYRANNWDESAAEVERILRQRSRN